MNMRSNPPGRRRRGNGHVIRGIVADRPGERKGLEEMVKDR
jgi:hypothetical protein